MATLDELQAQLTALSQRVNEITAPPDDYYTHRFSGEEIDNAVDRVKTTWEWLNPPLYLGVEYRTTEWFNGRPVYIKAFSVGNLPNASSKTVSHGIQNIGDLILLVGTSSAGDFIPYITPTIQVTMVQSGRTSIVIYASGNSSNVTATVILKYTKTTD